MARPKTPTNIHVLRGTGKVHPERMHERENEPKDDRPLGNPPKSLSAAEKKVWREIIGDAVPGVLAQTDRLAVETAARLGAKIRTGDATGAEYGQWIRLLSLFGFTPADRSKINLGGKGKSKNPFADD